MKKVQVLLMTFLLLLTVVIGYAQVTSSSIINTASFPYTWSVSGQSYSAPGIYNYTDPVSGVAYTLDLRDAAYVSVPMTLTYSYTADNFYTYTIPKTGWYFVEVSGAQGGSAGTKVGGKGARVQGYVRFQTGERVRIGVGKAGMAGTNDGTVLSGGGGGGASSVVLVNGTTYTPLMIAGGGGGAGKNYNGSSGVLTPNGGFAWGGTNGGGGGVGANSDFRGGAGGGGFNGNGQSHYESNGTTLLSQGGKSYTNGNLGGNGNASTIGGNGGWGGGGEGGPARNALVNSPGGGGGGGGFSGGGGALREGDGGGGGGSYVNPVVLTSGTAPVAGIQSGNGLVTLERLEYEPAQPVSNTYTFQGNTFQYFTAPVTGFYFVSARGAQGGGYNTSYYLSCDAGPLPNYNGGKGSHMQGYTVLKKGQVVRIAVGGTGGGLAWRRGREWQGTSFCDFIIGAGGGGASSIVAEKDFNFTPILIAGGGGGASRYSGGADATTSSSGTTGFYGTSAGGVNGAGGGGEDAHGAGGGGFYSNGGEGKSDEIQRELQSGPFANLIVPQFQAGQSYVGGNFGGTSRNVEVGGGWGGGGCGKSIYDPEKNGTCIGEYLTAFLGDFNQYFSTCRLHEGAGGGGGGYSGGAGGDRIGLSNAPPSGNAWDNLVENVWKGLGGGGGGSFSSVVGGQSDSSGVNTGNGLVTISGPNVTTESVTVPGPSYTWPANGKTYFQAGTWYFVDKDNFVVRVLDLSFGTPVNCNSYTIYDTTVVDTSGSYTWYINGRTYTENTVDSVTVGCDKYILRLTASAPNSGNAPLGGGSGGGNRIINMGELEGQGLLQTDLGYDWSSKSYRACRNSMATFTMSEVPFATSYQWLLPNGATGSSNTNDITISFGNGFTGGSVCVVPLNAIGAGDTLCMNVVAALSPPTGRLDISKTPAPKISGYYMVTPIAGATTYTWSVSNNQAVIVSGQGTPMIQLEAAPAFSDAVLSVVASNCKGAGPRTQTRLEVSRSSTARMKSSPVDWSISVSPNPSNGQFLLNNTGVDANATVEVYSTEGRLVYQQIIPANTTQTSIDLLQPATGLYQVRVVAGDEVRSLKVVVQ